MITVPPADSIRAPRAHGPDDHVDDRATTIVRFDDVERRYGDVLAIAGVDLTIRSGETIALLGPNGAGKSTAIGLMLGLIEPTGGTVTTLGLPPRDAVASGRVGSMLQDAGLPVNVTVGELVAFARRLYPQPLAMNDILERAGLAALTARSVDRLSGGEAQRLRFAIAIAGDPDLVFLDEPTVSMDVETRSAFWTDMRRSAAEGRTILFATHYLEEADHVADRIIVLDHGRIVADGTGRSIKSRVGGRTIRFDTTGADRTTLSALPGVADVEIHGDTVRLATTDADGTVRALFTLGLQVRDLEITSPDLEEAFLALTSTNHRQSESNR